MLVACREHGQRVLEVIEPLEKIGIAVGIEQNTNETASLRDVHRLLALPQRVELAAEARTKILSSDNPGHLVLSLP